MHAAIADVLGFPGFASAGVAVSVVLVIAPCGLAVAAGPADHATVAVGAAGSAVASAARVAVPDGLAVAAGPADHATVAVGAAGSAVVFAARVAVPDGLAVAAALADHASAASAAVLLVVSVDTLFLFDILSPASVAAKGADNF